MASPTHTIAQSPPRRKAEVTGPLRYCGCGRAYRDVRRGVTLLGLQRVGTEKLLPGAPKCQCGRKLYRFTLQREAPLHRCDFCNAELGLEDLAEASKRDGFCHHCKDTHRCPNCKGRSRTWGTKIRSVCYGCDLDNTQRIRYRLAELAGIEREQFEWRSKNSVINGRLLCDCGKNWRDADADCCVQCQVALIYSVTPVTSAAGIILTGGAS